MFGRKYVKITCPKCGCKKYAEHQGSIWLYGECADCEYFFVINIKNPPKKEDVFSRIRDFCYYFRNNCSYAKWVIEREHWLNFSCAECDLRKWNR